MRNLSLCFVVFAVAFVACLNAGGQDREYLPGSLEALIDLQGLPVVDTAGKAGMFSSTDPKGHGHDCGNFMRMDGDEHVMAEMEGPGVVTRIWSANAHGKLRIYLDDRKKPAIECMFKDIFEDRFPPFQSPISGKSSGGWYSYWPIGYEKYCRIAVTQDPSITKEREKSLKAYNVSVSVKGAKELKLIVNDARDTYDSDHADWADAKLIRPDGSVLYLSDIRAKTPDARMASTKQGWGKLMLDRSVEDHGLSIDGRKFKKGLGTHTNGETIYELKGAFDKFEAVVGLDDEVRGRKRGSIIFSVEVDGKELYKSDVLGFRKVEGALESHTLFYHINYETYPEGTKILPFTRELAKGEKGNLERVLEIWKNRGVSPYKAGSGEKKLSNAVKINGRGWATLVALKGAGYIYSRKMKLKSDDKRAYRRTVIKMYWDGEEKPSVWVPYGDFFGSGFGHVEFNSLPVGMGKDSRGGRTVKPPATPVGVDSANRIGEDECYSYWVMPFAKGARIEVENGSKMLVEVTCEILWQSIPKLPADTGRFCAQWRNEIGKEGKLLTLLDVKGTGKFVGLICSAQGLREISYLEGNEQYFIDGEEEPSIVGTGTEDFFNGGWYYNKGMFDLPLHGLTEKEKTLRGRTSQYRLQIPDAVTFRTAFKLLMEHGWSNVHLDDDFATTTYFYMLPPIDHSYDAPKASELNFPRRVLVRPNLPGKGARGDEGAGVVKMREARFAEDFFDKTEASCPKELTFWKDISEGYEGTNLAIFMWWPRVYLIRNPEHDPRAKEPHLGDVIVCEAKKVGDYLEIPSVTTHENPGIYVCRYWLVKGPDYGQVKISVAGKTVAEMVDLYAEEVEPSEMVSAGVVELPSGPKMVRVEVIGRNEASRGMKFGVYVEKTLPAVIAPQHWSIIGPFPLDKENETKSFAKEWPPENELDLSAKYQGAGREVAWADMPDRMAEVEDYQAMCALNNEPQITYALTYVESASDRKATLEISHSLRPIAVFLNGEKVYEKTITRLHVTEQGLVKTTLKKGANTLLLKLANTRPHWKARVRFIDEEGNSIPGLRFVRRVGQE